MSSNNIEVASTTSSSTRTTRGSSANRMSKLWERISGSPTSTTSHSVQEGRAEDLLISTRGNDDQRVEGQATRGRAAVYRNDSIGGGDDVSSTPTPISRTRNAPSNDLLTLRLMPDDPLVSIPRLSFVNGSASVSLVVVEGQIGSSEGVSRAQGEAPRSETEASLGLGRENVVVGRVMTRSMSRKQDQGLFDDVSMNLEDGEESMSLVDDEACYVDESEGKVDFIASLPQEISLYILLHLPLLSLLSATEVSHVWQQLALDNLVWRDLFHRESRWRIREDLGETTARPPSKQLSSISAPGSRRNSMSKRARNGSEGVSGSRLVRKLSDMMSDLGGLSLTPMNGASKRRSVMPFTPQSPGVSDFDEASNGSPLDPNVAFRSPPVCTATPRRPAFGAIISPFSLSAGAALSRTASTDSATTTPGPSRRPSSATIPPLGPVPSPSFGRVPSAPLFLDWPKLYRDRYLLEKRWTAGAPHLRKLAGHEDSVYCMQFDDDKIITGSRDKTMKVWDMRTGHCVRTLRGHSASVLCLQYDAKVLVSGSSDCRVHVWDLVGDERTGSGQWGIKMTLLGHSMGVLDLCFDDEFIVTCSKDTTIRVWHKATGEHYRTLLGHRGPVNAIQLLSGKIISASGDSFLKLWDLHTGEVIRVFSGHRRGLACVQLAASGKIIASGSNDKTVRIWDVETGVCLKILKGHRDLVRTLAFDETRGRLISGSYDKSVRVWDLDTGETLLSFNPHSSLVFDVSFSASKIITSSHDHTITVLDFGVGLDVSKFL